MGNFFAQAGGLIVQTVFGLLIVTVLLRFMLQVVRADFYNPFSQFIVRLSNPLLLPLRRIIPGFGGIDVASVVLLLILQTLKIVLIVLLSGIPIDPAAILIAVVAELLELILWVYIIAVFVRVIGSWFSPYGGHPLMDMLVSLTEPLMRPARTWIRPISGIDLSPIAVLLFLQILLLLLANIVPRLDQLIH